MPGMLQPKRDIAWNREGTYATITIKSLLNSPPTTRTLNFTRSQWEAWQGGLHIQHAFPHLSAEDREWLMSGLTKEQWDKMFMDDDLP